MLLLMFRERKNSFDECNQFLILTNCKFVFLNSITGSVTPTNMSSPSDLRHNNIQEYDSQQSHKRPRISEGWSTDQL